MANPVDLQTDVTEQLSWVWMILNGLKEIYRKTIIDI